MKQSQWETLLDVIAGKKVQPLPVGFIIDSPWLPNWYGINILDYFSSEELWFKANNKAHETFPDVMFLPGFWSEFGMCTEPSAFGARGCFPVNEFPHAHKMIFSEDDIKELEVPNPETDGMLPFMLNRLRLASSRIEGTGYSVRFSVARGPLNIASYLMGTTELLTMMMMQPDVVHLLLDKITKFLESWLALQKETITTIDGIFLLDDIIGFLGADQFNEFAKPYFKRLFSSDVSVRFLHNDAPCRVSSPFLSEMGVNLFNMGFDVPLNELRQLTGDEVTLVGNIPPRDVLAAGNAEDIQASVKDLIGSLESTDRIIFSCGGGMPPGVSTENIQAFVKAVQNC